MNTKKNSYNHVISVDKYEKTFFLSQDIVERIIHYVTDSNGRRLKLNIEELVEVNYLKYLLKVLNSNEQYILEFKNLCNCYLSKEDLENIIKEQMGLLLIDGSQCFENICIQRRGKGVCYFKIICSKEFYTVCHRYSGNIDISVFN
ncbi:hypothetical protein INF30_11455 [Lachnospiraceae bacterium DSM 108991]|uniref:Uncharacterized protein n=1 Tax=Claveliimonas monacensis TaxID=2779351 RepID=A0ABR9RLN3_9FIRM|nr:hypothetical protein [Claveliimonas monacensis]MBE5063868.1 hypothetical protein [Claveliimonas monacensis]